MDFKYLLLRRACKSVHFAAATTGAMETPSRGSRVVRTRNHTHHQTWWRPCSGRTALRHFDSTHHLNHLCLGQLSTDTPLGLKIRVALVKRQRATAGVVPSCLWQAWSNVSSKGECALQCRSSHNTASTSDVKKRKLMLRETAQKKKVVSAFSLQDGVDSTKNTRLDVLNGHPQNRWHARIPFERALSRVRATSDTYPGEPPKIRSQL